MAKCKSCNGTGYNGNGTCLTCNGGGSVDWWKTKEYQYGGKTTPDKKVSSEKASAEIAAFIGLVSGGFIFVLTKDFGTAMLGGTVVAVASIFLFRFISKYFFFCLIAIILYFLFR